MGTHHCYCRRSEMPPASRGLYLTLVLTLVSLDLSSAARPVGPDKNGLGRRPPMGWNTWCTGSSCHQEGNVCHGKPCAKKGPGALHDVCTEEMVKSVASAMLDN